AIPEVSVGPWASVIAVRPAHRSTRPPPTRSDPTTQCRTPGRSSGSSELSREGLTLAADTPAPAIRPANRPGSARSAADATTRNPPADSTTTTSITAASNPNDANCKDPTPGPAPNA